MARPTGTTTWIDLGTNDLQAAQDFYTALFGWTFEDTGEENGHYAVIRQDGALVGGAMDVSGMTDATGEPLRSSWDVYLAAEDVEERVARAQAAGAEVVLPPGDVGTVGRFASLLDPGGHQISLWQAGDLEGYEFTGEPGSPVWFELMTHDVDGALRFYEQVVDARFVPMSEPMEDDSFRYYTNGPADRASWGLCDATGVMPEGEGGWRIYLAVEASAPALERIEQLGGHVIDGPIDSPFGRIATIADPTGATFQITAMREAVAEDGGAEESAEEGADQDPRAGSAGPEAAPPVVDRAAFEQALEAQVALDTEVTHAGDRAAAARRRLPMVEVQDYEFAGPDGPVHLSELFAGRPVLLVQHVMFGPDWDAVCPACSWSVDNLPTRMERLHDAHISFAMISQAPIEKLRAAQADRGWPHTWVSSGATTFHDDWGWTGQYPDGSGSGPVPGYSYYLLKDGRVYLTYVTRARGTEAILPVAHIQDRSVYGRRQDWEDSPEGWPQEPTDA